MYTTFHRPTVITPSQLDTWLEKGWFRIGATMMWCRLILFNGTLRSTVWTRLDMADWSPRKSQRKLMRRVERDYDVTIEPFEWVGEAHEDIWTRYRAAVRGERPATAREALFGHGGGQLFKTWQVTMRRHGALVGWSWFDVGESAVQSVLAAYDPRHADDSLGYATLLFEIEWARSRGFRYHYAGYVMPGEPAMDYKHRVGALEFLDERDQWRPWSTFDPNALPSDRLNQQLRAVEQGLTARGVPATVRTYEMYEAAALNPELAGYLADPLILTIEPRQRPTRSLVVTWRAPAGPFRLLQCTPTPGYLRTGTADNASVRPVELLLPARLLFETNHVDDLLVRAEQAMR